MPPALESSRLLLRPYRADDAPAVQRLAGDRRIADTTTTIPHPYPDGAAEAWIATHTNDFEARKQATFAVTLRSTGELLGTVSLLDVSVVHARAELGYWIGAPYWGQGYCTEAVCRLIPFAYEELGTTRLVARCFARNEASARVMEKSGLRREGLLIQHTLKNGRFEDVLLYGLVLPGRAGEA
jgi:[ribosomal protein S5]-alanine N-acetyltransferase